MQPLRCGLLYGRMLPRILGAAMACLVVAAWASFGCEKTSSPNPSGKGAAAGIPRLVDLGARHCIPCKRMAPILEELQAEYAGSLDVVFIDVSQDAVAAKIYNVETIPVQIFLDASGTELFRHEGFFAKEEILAKWKELGFSLEEKRPTPVKGA